MAAALAGVSLSTPSSCRVVYLKSELPGIKLKPAQLLSLHARRPALLLSAGGRSMVMRSATPSTPPGISEKVEDSIKNAEETCAENAESGECVAAWDEVEELSAAASHAREKLKANSDPLENYCKDNPETDECRTYDD